MDFFVIDTVGASRAGGLEKTPKVKLPKTYRSVFDGTVPTREAKQVVEADSEDDDDYGGLPPPSESISKILNEKVDDMPSFMCTVKQKTQVGRVSAFVADTRPSTSKGGPSRRRGITQGNELNRTDVSAEMKNAVLTPAIEKTENIARLGMTDQALQKLNRMERQKTKGKNWFDMPAPEMTPELNNELQLIKMRSVLDPKYLGRVEKRENPKYFELGKVLESPLDHFNERDVRKNKSRSLVDELLADAEFQKFNKRKYAESLEKKKKKAYHKAVMKMKKEKKKKK